MYIKIGPVSFNIKTKKVNLDRRTNRTYVAVGMAA
jgi:hypothetical protein